MERDIEIDKIKKRMRELGYNQRSLSMAATGKEDTLRNLFEGKSRNLRSDNYKSIMKLLWPDGEEAATTPTDKADGTLAAVKMLMVALLERELLKAADLESLFSYQVRELRLRNQSDAAETVDELLAFVRSSGRAREPQVARKTAQPLPDQSKKKKS